MAQGVVRRVERDGEGELQFFGSQFLDARQNPDGRNRDVAHRNADFIVHQMHAIEDVLKIQSGSPMPMKTTCVGV